jgi:hypothetical protein
MEMRKSFPPLFTVAVAIVVVVAGCSGAPDHGVAKKNSGEKPKTVVVNKGLSTSVENKLNDRLDKLEKKVGAQGRKGPRASASASAGSGQSESSQAQAEDQARAAAETYYEAVTARNWGYTYDHLDSETQSAYTEQEWSSKNDYLADTGAVTYTIQSVEMDSAYPETVADVTVVLTATDGSANVRDTYFVYEGGVWKHRFSPEEYDLLANAQAGSASASATASASPSPSPSATPSPSPSSGEDIDCDQVQGPVPVPPGDPNNLDGDNDGLACE